MKEKCVPTQIRMSWTMNKLLDLNYIFIHFCSGLDVLVGSSAGALSLRNFRQTDRQTAVTVKEEVEQSSFPTDGVILDLLLWRGRSMVTIRCKRAAKGRNKLQTHVWSKQKTNKCNKYALKKKMLQPQTQCCSHRKGNMTENAANSKNSKLAPQTRSAPDH